MTKNDILLPTNMYTKSEYDALSPPDREAYIKTLLIKILKLNKNGVTIPQITKALNEYFGQNYISRLTIWRHLELFASTREAYKIEYGVSVYYHNGIMIHHLFKKDFQLKNRKYGFIFVKNLFGDELYVQEKETNKHGTPVVAGGLNIPLTEIEKFADILGKAKGEAEDFLKKAEA